MKSNGLLSPRMLLHQGLRRYSFAALSFLTLCQLSSCGSDTPALKPMIKSTAGANQMQIPIYTGRLDSGAVGDGTSVSVIEDSTVLRVTVASYGYAAPFSSFRDSLAILVVDSAATTETEIAHFAFYIPDNITVTRTMLYKDGKLGAGEPSPLIAVTFVPSSWIDN